jgi:alpha-beta hydrolase superfamily lysophospholipase
MPEKKLTALFIAIHGGLAHCGDWVTPALFFKEYGIATYAYDLRFQGTYAQYNKGKSILHINRFDDYIQDTLKFIVWVEKQHPNIPVFLLAHSLGALIVIKLALTHSTKETMVKGIIISSPWLENKVKVSKLLLQLSTLLSIITPTLQLKPIRIIDQLTHDTNIYQRHLRDEQIGLRAQKFTARFGRESLNAQNWVLKHIDQWKEYPLFAVIAGDDYLAEAKTSITALNKIDSNLLTIVEYSNNFHENFNELNRNEIFSKINLWIQSKL